jgi:hypothetical protein
MTVTANENLYDSSFSVDPKELQVNEMAQGIQQISGAVMGIAELVLEIKTDLRAVQTEIIEQRQFRSNEYVNQSSKLSESEKVTRNHALAAKLEKLFDSERDPKLVEKTKAELKERMELNFIRFLSGVLINGPVKSPERKEDIRKLMRSVVNGEMDFTPVVENLPFIMRTSGSNQLLLLLNTLKKVWNNNFTIT